MALVDTIGEFGDERRALRGAWLYDRIVRTGSLVIRRLGEVRAREIAIHRFLDSPEVTVEEIVSTLGARTAERCAQRRFQITELINTSARAAFSQTSRQATPVLHLSTSPRREWRVI